jgi:hypothetical protein
VIPTVLQVGKQVVVAWSTVRAVRVVRQLPVEMLRQCLVWAAVWWHTLSWRSTTPNVSIPRLLFWIALHTFFSVLQYASDIIMVPCCKNSTVSTPFLSHKTVAIGFLADNVDSNFVSLLGGCVCIHCFDCSLVSTFTNETQVSSPITRMMWLGYSSPALCYCSKKVKAKGILCILCAHLSVFRTHLAQNLWQPNLSVIIS